jgi:hypothetical protein
VPNELVTEAIEQATVAGKSLDEIDAEIIEPTVLSPRQKGALFLFAYSLRQHGEQCRYARESLTMTGVPLPKAGQGHYDRPLWNGTASADRCVNRSARFSRT